MSKLLFFIALVANVILIVSSGTTSKHREKTYSSSSADSSSSSSSSSSSETNKGGSSESNSSSNSSASSNSNSTSDTYSDDSDNEGCSSDNDERCGPDEQYSECPFDLCQPQTCAELGFPISCPGRTVDGSCPGKPGCICKNGYVRNCKGKCIPTKQCPSCGGDHNARAGCGVNCNRHCSDIGKEPGACIEICYFNACDCKENYVLDDNTGKCVLPEQCTPTCPKNEMFSNCTNGGCDARNCSQLGKPVPCVHLREDACQKGCVCIDGYLRADNGICVPKSECPSCNGDPNATSGCGTNCGKHCSNHNISTVACPHVCIVNGCDCKENYLYDDNINKCVLPKDCTPICKQHEVYSNCINGGCDAKNCSQIGKPVPCFKISKDACIKGCICEEGYLRADNGTCIPKDLCPNICTKPNEVYELCPAKCPFRTCGIDDRLLDCVPPPKIGDPECPPPACRCKVGFFRDDNGNCVEWENCPVCENPNEEYDPCPALCPQQKCDVDVTVILCRVPPQLGDPDCKPGCRCKESYVRNDKGICIPRDQCPQQCDEECSGTNEVCDECPGCSPQTCESIGKTYNCPLKKNCKPACRCKPGYYRNALNECISKDDCLKCPGENEFFACGSACDNVCATLNTQNRTSCPIINIKCNEKCYCKDGYARDSNNVCIPIDQCKAQQCDEECSGANEVCDKCPGCSPQTCESIGKTYNCPLMKNCKPACRCKPGYYRNALNECISKDDCLKCTGENEFFACDSACDNVCATLQTQNRTNCPIINVKCNEKCYCKDGYARDCNNVCVPVDQCEENKCNENEVYEECPNLCQPQTCDQYGTDIFCPAQKGANGACLSKPACICKEGYLRNKKGVCIPKEECTTCGGDPNAKPGCGINCNRQCSNYNKEPMACIALCRDNACDCKEGYVFDGNIKKCVKPKDCTPTCKINEVYSECIQGVCRAQNCTEKGEPVPCPDILPGSCKKGCICAENYLRASNGTCVPEDECDVCPEGEIFEKCPPVNCDADEYCRTSRDDPITCPESKECGKPKCVCGYLDRRDRTTGKCVRASECPPFRCDGPHEAYDSCPPGCPGENCSDYINNSTCPKLRIGIVVPCKPACRCDKGYYRNSKGICVSAKECVAPPNSGCDDKCGENERYVDCPSALCQPQKCSEAGFPVKCPKSNGRCADKPGCVCIEGYLRNSKGVCIPKENCPSCRGDKNARPGCGVNCGKLCSTYKVKDPICPAICDLNGCDCIDGTVYDETKKKCVSPNKCPPPNSGCDDNCGENERYVDCPSNLCQPQKCSEAGFPVKCPKSNGRCADKPGCVCVEGYLRNSKGVCIPKENCPSCGGDKNARPGCGVNCGKLCSTYKVKDPVCIDVCDLNGCDCIDGTVYDETKKKCVSPNKCPCTTPPPKPACDD